jgi:diadenosine tetraphosphate (Ap4A) HIT family hydrolase
MDCIFCKIVKGELPSYKIYEDDEIFAFLDIFPNIEGQTVVIPKKHTDSDVFKLSDEELKKFVVSVKKIAEMLRKSLKVKRVGMVFEGTGVYHLHAKLYPMKEEKDAGDQKIYFGEYAGYLTTLMGHRADDKKLTELANKIRKSTANYKV